MQVPGCQHGRLCCKEEELSTQSTWVKHRSYRTALGLSCPRGASVHPSDSNAHRDGICCSSAPEQSQGQLTLLKRCTCGPEVSRFLCCAQLNQFGTKRGESPLGAELPAVSIKLKKVKSLKKKKKICEHKVKKKTKGKNQFMFYIWRCKGPRTRFLVFFPVLLYAELREVSSLCPGLSFCTTKF